MRPDPTKSKWVDRWVGETVACIASGPSLTQADCDAVRARGWRTIVTNTTYQLAPWADALFAFDGSWWRQYRLQVDQVFKGDRLTCSSAGRVMGAAESLLYQTWFAPFQNSGASAISLAVVAGAERIILLGYDCQKTGGQSHWHGDHPSALSNALSIKHWPRAFRNVSRYAKERGTPVINCTRETALDCFPRQALESVL
jgi:hypothetical protein